MSNETLTPEREIADLRAEVAHLRERLEAEQQARYAALTERDAARAQADAALAARVRFDGPTASLAVAALTDLHRVTHGSPQSRRYLAAAEALAASLCGDIETAFPR